MGINFPASPVVGDLYPVPPQAGVPQYKWDGTVWVANVEQPLTYVKRTGDTMTGILALSGDPVAALDAATKQYADARALDVMAYSGMQINGSFDVSQELVPGVPTSTTFVCDGWKLSRLGTSLGQVYSYTTTAVPGFTSAYFSTVTTAQPSLGAADYLVHYQYIEGYRTARLAWGTASAKPLTIAFWSWHARTGVYTGTIRNAASDRFCAFSYTQAVADTIQYNVVTIPGCTTGTWSTTNGVGLQLLFCQAVGTTYQAPTFGVWHTTVYLGGVGQVNAVAATSDVFRITGVIVLPGIYAPTAAQSPLIMRPYDQELATCQRYFQRLGGSNTGDLYVGGYISAGTSIVHTLAYTTEMRAIPTTTLMNTPWSTNAGTALVNSTGTRSLSFQIGSGAAGYFYIYNTDATRYIKLDARL